MVPLLLLARIGEFIMKGVPALGTFAGLVAVIYNIGEKMVAAGLNLAIDSVSRLDMSLFSNASFGLVTGIGYVNAVFPLAEFITIWTAVFTAATAVLTIRWVKSFIPTVAN